MYKRQAFAFAFLSVVVVAFECAFSNAVAPPNATNLCTPSHCNAVNVCPHRGPGWSDDVSWHKPWNSAESIRAFLSALRCAGKAWSCVFRFHCLGFPTLIEMSFSLSEFSNFRQKLVSSFAGVALRTEEKDDDDDEFKEEIRTTR